MMLRLMLVVAGLALVVGCAPKEEPAPPAVGNAAPQGDPPAPGGGPGGAPGGGPGGGFGMSAPPAPKPDAPLAPTPKEDQAIADAEKAGDKKAISKAYLERAVRHRIDDKAGDDVKFPAVLADIKKALEADPTNERAQKLEKFVRGMIANRPKPADAKKDGGAGKDAAGGK